MLRKLFSVQSLLWLALLLALVGSLRHVAWGFSTLEQGNLTAGYVQAVAVDVGLFALAVGIQQRRRQKRGAGVLWLGVILFAGLSTYANLLHGIVFRSELDLSTWTSNLGLVSWLDFMRPVLMSGVLPLLVVYLSEIAGADISHALDEAEREKKQRERERQKSAQMESVARFPAPIEHANEQRRFGKEQAINIMLAFYSDNPSATQEEAGRACGRSRSWVSNRLPELEQAGIIERNGEGIEVLQFTRDDEELTLD